MPASFSCNNNCRQQWVIYLSLPQPTHFITLILPVLSPSHWGGWASSCWFVWLRSTQHISQIFVAWEKHFLSSLTGGVTGGDYERCQEAAWNNFEVSKSVLYKSVSELSARNDFITWVSREQMNFLWSYDLWCFNAPATTDLITEKWQMKVICSHVYKHTQMDNFAFFINNLLQMLVYLIMPHIRRIQGWLSSSGTKLFLISWAYWCVSYLTTASAAIQTHHVGKCFLKCQQELSRLGGFRQKSKGGTEERELQFCLFVCLFVSFLKVADWPSKRRRLLIIFLPMSSSQNIMHFYSKLVWIRKFSF